MKKPTARQSLTTAVSAAAVLAALGAGSVQAAEFKWPRLLVIGAAGTNSGSFASTNGWVPILQKDVGMTIRVVPEDNEPMRYRRLTDRKDIAISSVSAAEMRFQIQGIGGYAATPPAAQRMLWHHNDTPWGYVVPGDSKIKSMEDLKKGGFKIAQGVFSPPMTFTVTKALPAYLGMTEEDAKKRFTFVPASSYAENCRSVVEGKADISYCAPTSSVTSEIEGAPGGIRWIPMPAAEKENWARYLEHRPMLVPAPIEIGVSTARGVPSAVSNFIYAITPEADADFVYNMAKWMHKSFDAYKDTHPLAARMSLKHFREYLDRTPIPVHEGTIRYLREIGAWTEKDDAWQNEAVARMDGWVKARKAALDEARKAGVKIDFNDEAFMKIHAKHTKGLEGFKTRL